MGGRVPDFSGVRTISFAVAKASLLFAILPDPSHFHWCVRMQTKMQECANFQFLSRTLRNLVSSWGRYWMRCGALAVLGSEADSTFQPLWQWKSSIHQANKNHVPLRANRALHHGLQSYHAFSIIDWCGYWVDVDQWLMSHMFGLSAEDVFFFCSNEATFQMDPHGAGPNADLNWMVALALFSKDPQTYISEQWRHICLGWF